MNEIEIAALLFALLTGYIAVRYEGTVTSRIAVVMLLVAAGGSVTGKALDMDSPFTSTLSLVFLIFGHITSEVICKKFIKIGRKTPTTIDTNIENTNQLLKLVTDSENLNLETEINIKIK